MAQEQEQGQTQGQAYTPGPLMAPEWQERSLEAANERVRVAREREAAATEQRVSDEQANAAGEPGGYGRPADTEADPEPAKKTSTRSKKSADATE